MPNWEPNEADILFYVNLDIPRLLKAEEINGLDSVPSKRVILFELAQYGPLLPLNSQEVDRLFFSRKISRADLVSLLVPDEPVWEPLGCVRRKELLKMAIGKVGPWWLTFRPGCAHILEVIQRKWDFETDRPKPREK